MIIYAARNNFTFDAVYWRKIDQRFFGRVIGEDEDLSGVWRKRLDLLQPGEKALMEECVDLKVKDRDTWRLKWDPDEYTVEWIERLRTKKEEKENEEKTNEDSKEEDSNEVNGKEKEDIQKK